MLQGLNDAHRKLSGGPSTAALDVVIASTCAAAMNMNTRLAAICKPLAEVVDSVSVAKTSLHDAFNVPVPKVLQSDAATQTPSQTHSQALHSFRTEQALYRADLMAASLTNDDVSHEISRKLQHPQFHRSISSPAVSSRPSTSVTPRIKQNALSLVPIEGYETLKPSTGTGTASTAAGSSKKKSPITSSKMSPLLPHSKPNRRVLSDRAKRSVEDVVASRASGSKERGYTMSAMLVKCDV